MNPCGAESAPHPARAPAPRQKSRGAPVLAGVRSPGCGLMEAEQKARKTLFKEAPTPRVSPQPPRNRGPLRAFREESNGVYSPAQRQAQSRAAAAAPDQAGRPGRESSNARRPAQRQAQNRTAAAAQNQAHRAPQGKQQCASLCTAANAKPHGLGGPRSSPIGPDKESSNARRPAQRQAQRRAAPAAPDQAGRPGRERINARRPAQRQAQSRAAPAAPDQAGRPGKESSNARRPAQRQAQSRAASAAQDQAHRARQGKQQCASPCTEAGAEPHGPGGPKSSP